MLTGGDDVCRYFAGALSKDALVKYFVDVAEASPIPVMYVWSYKYCLSSATCASLTIPFALLRLLQDLQFVLPAFAHIPSPPPSLTCLPFLPFSPRSDYPGAAGGLDLSSNDINRMADKSSNINGVKLTCGGVGKLTRITGYTKSEAFASKRNGQE